MSFTAADLRTALEGVPDDAVITAFVSDNAIDGGNSGAECFPFKVDDKYSELYNRGPGLTPLFFINFLEA